MLSIHLNAFRENFVTCWTFLCQCKPSVDWLVLFLGSLSTTLFSLGSLLTLYTCRSHTLHLSKFLLLTFDFQVHNTVSITFALWTLPRLRTPATLTIVLIHLVSLTLINVSFPFWRLVLWCSGVAWCQSVQLPKDVFIHPRAEDQLIQKAPIHLTMNCSTTTTQIPHPQSPNYDLSEGRCYFFQCEPQFIHS